MGKQEEVNIFMRQYDLEIKPAFRALDIAAEFGEVSAEILRNTGYGEQKLESSDQLEEELGDLYFALIALANQVGVDLDNALDSVIAKYERRLENTDSPSSEKERDEE